MKMLPVLLFVMLSAACNSSKKAERVFGNELFQHWIHSYEDDGTDYRAFRPADYAFPPARGREGFEINKDGSFVHHQIGPADGPVVVQGKWKMKGKNTLSVTPSAGEPFEIQIIAVEKGMLKTGN